MGAISAETLEIDRLLRSALPEDEFELHYQPQVTSDGQIESVEALLRWTSPTLGRIAPSRFIPLAEENGMIVPLGEWVLREACRQTAVWHRHGFPSLRVAVNVSAHQFVRPDFADTVALALRDSRLQPQFLELELTETAVVRKPEINMSQFQKLGRLGVRISIDDFGTGNFSLKYLLQLPADALKIDRSFIDALGRTGRDSLLLVRAIIGMAHAWQLQVVAEGIETQAQLSILRSEGCDLSQGYFLYKPMSAAAFSELLSAQVAGASQTIELATRDLLAIVGTESPAHKGMGYETCNSFSTALEK
jgi:EAL domain-containing protein (putative c-di-GMP-specific phosphodiesterase class I)